uniref:BZIP domain-containing protein n=1 Tax=Aureoumbra lagunensis TaxID=44058 RepID=A0A7S3K237_9STRA
MTENSEPSSYTIHPANTSNNTGEIQYQGPFLLAPSTSGSFLPVSSSPCSFTTEVKRTTGLGVPPSFLPVSSRGVYSMGMRNDTTSQARSIDRINEHDSYIPYVPFLPATPINMAPARDLLTSSRTTNGNANTTVNETQENYNDAAEDDGLYNDEQAREAMIRVRIRRERNRVYARQSRARKKKEIKALQEFQTSSREALNEAERQVSTLQHENSRLQQELEERRSAYSILKQEYTKLRTSYYSHSSLL